MSGRKNNLKKYQTVTNGDLSQASITSAVTNIQFLDRIGIQLNMTGTPTGAFQVQISADYSQDDEGNVLVPGNWIPLVLNPSPAATGSAAQIYIDILVTSAPWIRVVYTRASGSGTLNSFITAKMS